MRNETVVIYLSPRDKRLLDQASREANMSRSSFALKALLGILMASPRSASEAPSGAGAVQATGAPKPAKSPDPVVPETAAAVAQLESLQARLLDQLQRIELAAAAAHAASCLAAAASGKHGAVGGEAYRECLSMTLDGANAMLSSPPFAAALRAMANSR